MKTHLKLIAALVFSAFFMNACKDVYDNISLPIANNRLIVTSQMDFANKVRVGGEIVFGDISSGVESRTWTFPDGVADVLNSDNDKTSTEANVKAKFNKVGLHEVKLNQVFKGDAYSGKTLIGKTLDTTIIVNVLPDLKLTVKANVVNANGTLGPDLTLANGAKNQVKAGQYIRFTVTSVGEPTTFNWDLVGADPATSSDKTGTLNIRYKRMGTYGFSLVGSNPRPFGADTVKFTDLFTVIPSTDPVSLDGIEEKGGKLALNFSREMDGTSLKASDFTVSVVNKTMNIPTTVTGAAIDPTQGNVVLLSLSGLIYNDDKITVSYTKGSLTTGDQVAVNTFTGQPVVFKGTNILASSTYDYGFENANATWPYLGWGAPWDKFTLNVTSAKAHSGQKSAYIELQPMGGMIIGNKISGADAPFSATAGKSYEIGAWVYMLDLGNTPTGKDMPDLRFYWAPDTDWGVGSNPLFSPTFETGKWVYSSIIVKFPKTGDYKLNIRGFNQNNPSALKFYMDDITVSEAKIRP